MIPWKLLGRSKTPDHKKELTLHQRDTEYSIRVNGRELMNSRMFGSERMLAELSCPKIAERKNARALIGGLGMGHTLAAALGALHSDADVLLAELVPSVVEWNKNVLGPLAGDPLKDSRVTVALEDVMNIIKNHTSAFDAILLDVDNGPDSLTQKTNDELYSMSGLAMARRALRPGGVLAVWSSAPDTGFTQRLNRSSFHVLEKKVRARTHKKGPVHTIWIATKSCQ
ncbi:conserved hypothetical protein [Candidatus Desulfarcum epimagneticum]|uniref:Spermidine synthase n=1 Tax=uncultured Desulfobacteraceae bacterium TaxID=218296 RepID=A0A484HFR1_9BACT|nr:conserved hypothetical protein [uncultured Desulfobacteraceae bacterium]